MSENNEEKGYEVIDKRKVKLGEDGEVEVNPEAETGGEETEQIPEELSGLPPVDVFSLLKSFISLLAAQTWQWLGLIKNPVTGEMEKDLAQAKVAIDTISLLAGQIDAKIDDSERRELQAMLSDLRINFVQQSSK